MNPLEEGEGGQDHLHHQDGEDLCRELPSHPAAPDQREEDAQAEGIVHARSAQQR